MMMEEPTASGGLLLTSEEMEQQFISLCLEHCGADQRRDFAAGEMLLREGEMPQGLWLILSGRVELFRTIDGMEIISHSESAGRLVGLMSLSEQHPTFFSCRARTDVEALFIPAHFLQQWMTGQPGFARLLLAVMVRTMARRNRRGAQLLAKVRTLNQRLAEQRDDLEAALQQLRAAQSQLVEQAKMATLGNLAAGMAHELNNPVAAIQRAADFIKEDLERLFSGNESFSSTASAMRNAMQNKAMGSAEERAAKARLTDALAGDRNLANSLFAAGIRSSDDLNALLGDLKAKEREARLEEIMHGGQIGVSLRNLGNCSHRIADLVRSLKLHARDDEEFTEGVDLNQSIEDTLLLLSHRLRDITVQKHYGALNPITAHVSRLQQVWLNLLVNALQAMTHAGLSGENAVIEITTRMADDSHVEVVITDCGPGIPADVAPRLFEHRFTTRGGRVEFGLGLGLPISRMIVENHGGTLSFESKPGRTCFRTILPIEPTTKP
jgi:C4-dicarboxylate-specific signal transduction histidine kinase